MFVVYCRRVLQLFQSVVANLRQRIFFSLRLSQIFSQYLSGYFEPIQQRFGDVLLLLQFSVTELQRVGQCSQIFLLRVFLPFPILVRCREAKFYDSQILNALRNCTHMKPTETVWDCFYIFPLLRSNKTS